MNNPNEKQSETLTGILVFPHSHAETGEFLYAEFLYAGFPVDVKSVFKYADDTVLGILEDKKLPLDCWYAVAFDQSDGEHFISDVLPESVLTRAQPSETPVADKVEAMAKAYEEERAKYVGGMVYYPHNGAAHIGAMIKALNLIDQQVAPTESRRIQDLLECNNRYLERARKAEGVVADLAAKVEALRKKRAGFVSDRNSATIGHPVYDPQSEAHNAALDAVLALIKERE